MTDTFPCNASVPGMPEWARVHNYSIEAFLDTGRLVCPCGHEHIELRHKVYAGDGNPADADDYSDFSTDELVEWLGEQVRSELDHDYLRVEIHTYRQDDLRVTNRERIRVGEIRAECEPVLKELEALPDDDSEIPDDLLARGFTALRLVRLELRKLPHNSELQSIKDRIERVFGIQSNYN